MKKSRLVSILLCCCFPFTMAYPVAAVNASAKLYDFYTDNMLFEQNEDVNIAGTGIAGKTIKAELFDSENHSVKFGETTVSSDGTFEVSFVAPQGGFKEYKIVISENEVVFKTLNNVVFGELWLASGQSNMEFPLSECATYQEEVEKGFGSEWVRSLITPTYPCADSTTSTIVHNRQENIKDSKWVKANDPEIAKSSTYSYYFANKLIEMIKMPIGVLNINMGGSSIISWISREKIDNDNKAIDIIKSMNRYQTVSEALKSNYNNIPQIAIGCNYNSKTYPLRHFRIKGMIWYQGSSDLGSSIQYGGYSYLFNLLQDEISENFSYKNGLCPIIYSYLTAYGPFNNSLGSLNAEFSEMQKEKPDSRACVSVNDISLEYTMDNLFPGAIHPTEKKPNGERMAIAAGGLVYKLNKAYSAGIVKSSEAVDNSLFVTLNLIGDKIIQKGDSVFDGAICGEDGIYYKAEVEIVSDDTLKFTSEQVKKPVSATYSFTPSSERANLYVSENGEAIMPLAAFVINRNYSNLYFYDSMWMDSETQTGFTWQLKENQSEYSPIWKSSGCQLSIDENSAFDGNYGVKLLSNQKKFSITQSFNYSDNNLILEETNSDWSKYKSLTFKIKNNSKSDITIKSFKITNGNNQKYVASLNGTNNTTATIKADGNWHTITVDLNNLYFNNISLLKNDSNALETVKSFSINFSSKNETDLSFDDFQLNSTLNAKESKIPVSFIFKIINFFKKFSNIPKKATM